MSYAYVPSTWKRILAYSLDEIFMIPFYLPFVGIGIQFFWGEEDIVISLLQFFLILFVPAVYEFVFLLLLQSTPAKWFLGLKVVPAHDWEADLSWQQALLRALTKRLSLFTSTAMYVLALFRYDRTHLADWVAETRVVQATPRHARPRIRWFLGTILTVYFLVEGLSLASKVLGAIHWSEGVVSLSDVQAAFMPEEDIFGDEEI